jgi:hypothetical protein
MSAVIDFNAPLEAANLAAQRAKSYGYTGLATAQFVRKAARFALRGHTPWQAATMAVPHKSARNGSTPGDAA